jgi:YVTN family beta-propeller protein
MRLTAALAFCAVLLAEFRPPAGEKPAVVGTNGSIIPGGRVVEALGQQFPTGPGPFGLAISPSGRVIATANLGPERTSVTVLEQDRKGEWSLQNLFTATSRNTDSDFHSLFSGIAFANEKTIWLSEGDSGRVRLMDLASGSRKRVLDLNAPVRDGPSRPHSFAGNLAFNAARDLLYVLDQAHFRVVVFDTKKYIAAAEVATGFLPYAISLSPDGNRAWVTNVGLFRYRTIPGADAARALGSGIPFPAFGFPSPEAAAGAERENGGGKTIRVPPLGDPNVRESNSVCAIDTSEAAPKVLGFVRTGVPFGPGNAGGSSPSGVLATPEAVYVSNAHDDSVDVVDPGSLSVRATIPLRIPGLESLRGVLPLGMAFDESRNWLLVAEAGINALGVIDAKRNQVIGHLPVGWFPSSVAARDGVVTVANVKGHGTGPSSVLVLPDSYEFGGTLRRGSISRFPLPDDAALAKHTRFVMAESGFLAVADRWRAPVPVKTVVIIVKENRTFDEVFGDLKASNGPVRGLERLARFGTKGYADGGKHRFSLQSINVTPNHHALAERFAFSDNFYADSDVSVDGHHWIVGAYPDAWTESSLLTAYSNQKHFELDDSAPGRLLFAETNASVHPEEQEEAGSLWQHLERNHVSFHNFGEGFELAGDAEEPGEKPTGARLLTNVPMSDALYRNTSRTYPGFNMNIPDQYRAAQFIAEMDARYVRGGEPLPQVIFMHLPNDHTADPRPRDGYPYMASYVADNDLALGKIVEYLSHSPWWHEMAIFITEDDAQSGVDHVDAHRTVLLGVGPYFRKNYVSHVNASFPSILKTTFQLLGLPSLNLFDAAAADLADMFSAEPDFTPFTALDPDSRLFDPARAREPLDPTPSIPMDGPRPESR